MVFAFCMVVLYRLAQLKFENITHMGTVMGRRLFQLLPKKAIHSVYFLYVVAGDWQGKGYRGESKVCDVLCHLASVTSHKFHVLVSCTHTFTYGGFGISLSFFFAVFLAPSVG